jgi:hypothetical protein
MKKPHRYRNILPIGLVFQFIFLSTLFASEVRQNSSGEIIDRIEKGINDGNVEIFGPYLGPQVSISMSGDRSGWYSTNQAYSILKNYFGMRKTLSFAFTTREESDQRAIATGGGRFVKRGTKESVQIYVMLKYIEEKWIITQIHLY